MECYSQKKKSWKQQDMSEKFEKKIPEYLWIFHYQKQPALVDFDSRCCCCWCSLEEKFAN
jgi:hypothetical protein